MFTRLPSTIHTVEDAQGNVLTTSGPLAYKTTVKSLLLNKTVWVDATFSITGFTIAYPRDDGFTESIDLRGAVVTNFSINSNLLRKKFLVFRSMGKLCALVDLTSKPQKTTSLSQSGASVGLWTFGPNAK